MSNENLKSCRLRDIMKEIMSRNYPILDIGNREGHTGYIDFINDDEVIYPVMKGKDNDNRPFIIVKVIISNKVYVQTFFQRYYDDNDLWMGCMVWGASSFITTIGGMQMYQAMLIQNIINGDVIQIKLDHRPVFIDRFQDLQDQSVMLYDEEKWKAAKLIQRNWDICRYNPEYRVCQTVFNRGIHDIYHQHKIDLI